MSVRSEDLSVSIRCSVNARDVLAVSIRCRHPLIGYPFDSVAHVTSAMEAELVELTEPLVPIVQQVIVP